MEWYGLWPSGAPNVFWGGRQLDLSRKVVSPPRHILPSCSPLTVLGISSLSVEKTHWKQNLALLCRPFWEGFFPSCIYNLCWKNIPKSSSRRQMSPWTNISSHIICCFYFHSNCLLNLTTSCNYPLSGMNYEWDVPCMWFIKLLFYGLCECKGSLCKIPGSCLAPWCHFSFQTSLPLLGLESAISNGYIKAIDVQVI